MKITNLIAFLLTVTALTGCGKMIDKIDDINHPPEFAKVASPTEKPGYQPVSWPLPETPPPARQYANSLWQPGARAFFRDQRAARVGDILRVNVQINDKAELKNETDRTRDGTETAAAPKVFGLERQLIGNFIYGKHPADPAGFLDVSGSTSTKGTGSVKRDEKITTQVAALITQVLPNGNYVISGKQEVRVNYDLREISVQGVVRPQDIRSDNTIDSTQIAEARINYGGRGQIMDVQQPRWGTQFIEAVSPF